VVEGTHAHEISLLLIRNGWVTELSHAAYLGKELTKAELSLHYGFKYAQDGA
jgi:tetrahydromethanopterin S-methyltransferase subunit A